MRVDKKTKDEVLNIYDIWIHSYLNGDVETYNSYLDKSFHFIGSTANEEFLNKKDTSDFFRATSEQLAGKSQLRNEIKITEKFDDVIFITHLFDAWFLSGEDWSYYSRFRFTNALQKKKEGWRFIYQHYSTPDSKAQEGETIGYDKISAENLQLREAIQRRTKELEFKNRALEIEGALQRIRAEAVAMKESSDLLDIVVTMRREFTKLGHEAHYFWHMMWLEDKYEKAMTSGDGTKIGFVMELPRHIHGDIPLLANWEKSDEALVIYTMDTTAAITYVDKMITLGDFQNIDPQAPSHDDIRHIGGLTFIMARTSQGEIGFSLPGVVKNPPIEDLELLKQFASAFDLAHRRFLDLKKAEKQAREVQIELALEKVRSRTMAMQHSDELAEASFLLDAQIRGLGIKTWGCAFNIYGEKESTEWFGNEAGILHTYTVPRKGIFEEYYLKGQRGESLFIKEFSGEECIAHYEYMSTLPVIGDVLKTLKERNNGFPVYQIDHVAFFKYGYLLFITREQVPDAHEIFKRFANVFQQTYTRFLDLQKAEAQAHESQIELALERIRAQTMAMQKSEELTKIGSLLYQELSKLGIQNLATGYTLFDETATIGWNYGINPIDGSIRNKPVGMKHTKNKVMKAIASSWKKQDPLLVIQLNEKETIKHQTFIAEESINFPISKEKLLSISPKRLVVHTFNFKQGYLLIVGGKLLTVEQQEMITRFANVFQQTYTRFLDLKKAEAQTRESQIELALERVRARTMAMQKSEELKDVIQTVYEQFVALNINIEHSGFIIDYKKNDVMHIWLADKNAIQNEIKLPYFDSQHWNSLREAKKKGENFFANYLPFKEKNKFYKEVFKHIPNLPEDVKQFYFDRPALTISTVLLDNVGLYIENFDSTPYSEEENEILMRFGKVFQQTYTRFLDLQRAEAQTREAQVETALEKVRSRSMAMQQSYEIGEVAKVLYEQLTSLGGALWGTGFVFCEKKSDVDEFWFVNDKGVMPHLTIPHTKDPVHKAMYEGWKDNLEILSIVGKDKDLENHYKYMLTIPDVQPIFRGMLDSGITFPTWQKWHAAYFKHGYLLVITTEPYENEEIFKRFAIVFEQSYIRFLDLKKAEAQTREAKIEASLEKIRTVALSLRKSNEMLDIAKVLYEQLQILGFNDIRNALIDINDEKTETFMDYDYSELMGGTITKMAYDDDPTLKEQLQDIAKTTDGYSEMILEGKQLQDLIDMRKKNGEADDPRLNSATSVSYILYAFGNGAIGISNFGKLNENQKEILDRFRNVFTFAYNRYNELAKAEAQMREVQLEASLEKVRSVALTMQKPEDMLDIAKVLFEQLRELGFKDIRNAIIDVHNEDNETFWDYDYSEAMSGSITLLSYKNDPTLEEQYRKIVSTTNGFYEEIIKGQDLKEYVEMRIRNGEKDDPRLREVDLLSYYLYSFGNGVIGISNFDILNEDQKTILGRFRNVFTFAYKRYKDLVYSQAQAREVQIEAALEKVRSSSLAMQKPDELRDVVTVVAEKLQELGIILDAGGVIICTYFKDSKDVMHWISSPDFSHSQNYLLPYFDHPIFSEAWESKNSGDLYFSKSYPPDIKNSFFEYAFSKTDYKNFPDAIKEIVFKNEQHALSFAWQKNSAILIPSHTGVLPSESDAEIMKRFAKVFEQAYIRFMDLQKAEERARENQIDIALERVRNRTLAMQSSDELSETAVVVFKQLIDLGIAPNRLYIGIIKENKRLIEMWATDEDGTKIGSKIIFNPDRNKSIEKIFNAWKDEKKSINLVMQGKELSTYLKYLNEELGVTVTKGLTQKKRFQTIGFFSKGFIGIAAPEEQPKETTKILERFASVFNLTYTRFSDLKIAEAQTREAKIETALERVRARALAMQQPEELKEVANVLRTEMGQLGLEELETCSIYIYDEKANKTECWYALKDVRDSGKKLVSDYFKLNLKETWVGTQMLKFYNSSTQQTSIKMTGKNRIEWIRYCEAYSAPFQGYYGEEIPDRTYHLYKFSHGAIGAAAPQEISEENWELLKRAASVFSLAYSRFKDLTQSREDLQQLKSAKQRAEEALAELQQTQKQLIQSEKMASLGELTAGIAHEIQNPLNFVNNFSEVSNELIDEMNEEIDKGDLKEAKLLANDIKQNLEKINHHGKRADAIVKGMLQHSRKSTAEKEATDINKLADEYLRLAYHGLRAKDKNFNATLDTKFDPTIGLVKLIPQDMGRVILNLITNAFYACNEKSKAIENKNFKPLVTVSTKKMKDEVLVSVEDNGNGIPKKVLDKIFQPFFTTKPTGEGTGLGLSMSYDIIKAHNGELKVNTTEGKGTKFTIHIPTNI